MATMASQYSHESQGPPAKVYPPNANDDVDNPLYKQDHFRMYCLKVVPCSKRYCHDWTTCPFAHPAEKAKRRCPRTYSYTGVACPEMKKNMACPRGDQCPYAHNVFEYWLHPSRYRTQLCNDGVNCKRKICFFAHTLEELRVSSVKVLNPELARDGAFAETGGLDPFVVAQDTGFGLAQPRGAGNANIAATNSAPGFSLQDLQQLTQLHAKLQAASNMGAFSGLATQLQAQHMQNGAGDGTQAAMETLAQVLAQQVAAGQMGSPQHSTGQQQPQNADLVQLISQMLTQQQAQHMSQQQQAQQQAAAAAAVAQAQNQAQNHMATLQLLSQLQQSGMAGAYGQGAMGAEQFSPMHMMGMARPGMQHSPAMMQQQLAAQMAAAQGMGMRAQTHQARASPQHPHMQHGGARHSPQPSQHMGGGHQHGSSGPMPSPSAMDAEALAQRLAAMRTSPDNNMPQYSQQQQQVRGAMGLPMGPSEGRRSGSVGADQLATSPTQSRMPLANVDAVSPPQAVVGSRSNSVAGAVPMPMPQAASPQALGAPVADSTATGTSYFSNSHSPTSTDSSDAASHRSDASDELHGAVGAALSSAHSKGAGSRTIASVASPFHL